MTDYKEYMKTLEEQIQNKRARALVSEEINGHIEEQAQERFERIVEQMKQAQGITEQLKVDDTLEWIGRMNNIQACAREIVDKEMIYQ